MKMPRILLLSLQFNNTRFHQSIFRYIYIYIYSLRNKHMLCFCFCFCFFVRPNFSFKKYLLQKRPQQRRWRVGRKQTTLDRWLIHKIQRANVPPSLRRINCCGRCKIRVRVSHIIGRRKSQRQGQRQRQRRGAGFSASIWTWKTVILLYFIYLCFFMTGIDVVNIRLRRHRRRSAWVYGTWIGSSKLRLNPWCIIDSHAGWCNLPDGWVLVPVLFRSRTHLRGVLWDSMIHPSTAALNELCSTMSSSSSRDVTYGGKAR